MLFSPSLIAKMIIMRRALIVKLPKIFEFSSFKSYNRGTQIINKFSVSY
ncbi:hypothetical protein OIU77_000715 [Salix suchowensis]|uniref:Uncharacterized protein n=1 Tax=Salix suchowensis TaxID=1278906 RepID=A0ABQ9B756_9ROSI|nr:hypothetical protein OIU77_000715 [Salix suchowensis]